MYFEWTVFLQSDVHQQKRALCCPVSGAARAVLLPCQNQQWNPCLLVSLSSIKHIQLDKSEIYSSESACKTLYC